MNDFGLPTSRRRFSGNRPKFDLAPESMKKSDMTAADYFKLINIETAKLIAIAMVLGFGCYHGILNLTYAVTPCKGLFLDGVYKEGGDGQWQPWGCMMHKYTYTDSSRCFRYHGFYGQSNHFIFIGDSRLRQIYFTFQRFIETENFEDTSYVDEKFKAHHDLSWKSSGINIKLDFIWAPLVNDSMLEAVNKITKADSVPSLVILGASTHSIKSSNNSKASLFDYTRNMTVLRPILENLSKREHTKVLWFLQPHVNHEKLHPSRIAITNEAIDYYNHAAVDVLSSKPDAKIVLWNSLSRLAEAAVDLMEDGIHLPPVVLKQAVMMLLNQHCNEKMNFNDGSCCKSSDQPTKLQIITCGCFLSCLLVLTFKVGMKKLSGLQKHTRYDVKSRIVDPDQGNIIATSSPGDCDKTDALIIALVKMGFILAYFYVCDRTNFFMKENKYFTHLNFLLPVFYVLIVGLFFHEDAKQTTILHRQQTDEWKGWMQLVLLIYHMTGGSKSLPIYMFIRVLVSAFIFLNAYGHFNYAWKEQIGPDDYKKATIRFFTIILRMNFFAVLLCLAMNRTYQHYYFVPVISFWYLVHYLTHFIPPRVNASTSENQPIQYFYIILKLVGLVSVISILYISEVFFEKVFVTRPWKALFVTEDDDIKTWWFRWKIDRYSSVFGVLFGYLCVLASRYKLFNDADSTGSLFYATSANITALLLSLLGLGGYTLFSIFCTSKSDCIEIHPYIVFVPVVSFVVIRNLFGRFRSHYSSFFAWFGRISLELFLAQYHIWLAADSNGVLVLVPNYPVMNILLTSFIFVCAAHEVRKITDIVLPFLAPKNARIILRNVAIFVCILIPIGIHDGMF